MGMDGTGVEEDGLLAWVPRVMMVASTWRGRWGGQGGKQLCYNYWFSKDDLLGFQRKGKGSRVHKHQNR